MQVEAYLAGNCTECFTAKKAAGLPPNVSLCELDAQDEGWGICGICGICGEWESDWHRWGDREPICTACLTRWDTEEGIFLTESKQTWEEADCDCDRCYWRNRGQYIANWDMTKPDGA